MDETKILTEKNSRNPVYLFFLYNKFKRMLIKPAVLPKRRYGKILINIILGIMFTEIRYLALLIVGILCTDFRTLSFKEKSSEFASTQNSCCAYLSNFFSAHIERLNIHTVFS